MRLQLITDQMRMRPKQAMIRLALLLLAILFAPDWAGAATRFVDATAGACTGNYSIANRNCTGSDGTSYASISTGLQGTTTAGDNLWIRAGTYSATIVSADYTAGGTSWAAPITIGGCPAAVCGSDEYPTINTTASQVLNLTSANNKYTWFKRLVLDGVNQASGDPNAQWVRWTADHLRFDDVEVKNAKFHGLACIEGADGSEVINSRLHDIGNYSIGDNKGNALYWSCDFGLIEGNEFYANDYASAWFNPGSDNIFRNNISRDQRYWVNFSGSRNLIYNNLVWSLTGIAASISYDCAPHATPCSYGNKIYNNTIYNQPSIVFEIGSFFGADNNEIKNNVVVCTGGTVVPVKVYGADDDNNVITHNRWEGCGAISDSGTGTTANNNTTGASGFTDATAHDFTLTAGSALRDTGTDVSATVATDYAGAERCQGTACDIGAYEFVELGSGAVWSRASGISGMRFNGRKHGW